MDASIVQIGKQTLGGREVPVMAGPIRFDSYEALRELALAQATVGARILRAEVFCNPEKSREHLLTLAQVAEEVGMIPITRVNSYSQLEMAYPVVSAFLVNASLQHDAEFLQALAKQKKPVILDRGDLSRDAWLSYIHTVKATAVAPILLCESGLDVGGKRVLDLSTLPFLKQEFGVPVIVDVSKGTGQRQWIFDIARAALAAGADSLLLELHAQADQANCLQEAAITPEELTTMIPFFTTMAFAAGRSLYLEPLAKAE